MVSDLRININEDGQVLLSIKEETVTLNSAQVSNLLNIIMCAQNDVKLLKELEGKKISLLKNYNSVGKPVIMENSNGK